MSTRTTLTDAKAEKATAWLSATITDDDGVTPLADADEELDTLTMLLYESRAGTLINMTSARDVLNANGATVSSDGALLVRLDPADMVMLSTSSQEVHIALFEWMWGNPAKYGKHEVAFPVKNLVKVT